MGNRVLGTYRITRAWRMVCWIGALIAGSAGLAQAGGDVSIYAAVGAKADQSVLPPEAIYADLIPGAAPWRHRKSGDKTLPSCVAAGPPYSPECIAEAAVVGQLIENFHGKSAVTRRLLRMKYSARIGGATTTGISPPERLFNELRASDTYDDVDIYYKIDAWDPMQEDYLPFYHEWHEAQVVLSLYGGYCLPSALRDAFPKREFLYQDNVRLCSGDGFRKPFVSYHDRDPRLPRPPYSLPTYAFGMAWKDGAWKSVVELYITDRYFQAFPERWRLPICGTGNDRSFCASPRTPPD